MKNFEIENKDGTLAKEDAKANNNYIREGEG